MQSFLIQIRSIHLEEMWTSGEPAIHTKPCTTSITQPGSYEAVQPKAFDHTVFKKGKEDKAEDLEGLLQKLYHDG